LVGQPLARLRHDGLLALLGGQPARLGEECLVLLCAVDRFGLLLLSIFSSTASSGFWAFSKAAMFRTPLCHANALGNTYIGICPHGKYDVSMQHKMRV
jgi:hypothetical protein